MSKIVISSIGRDEPGVIEKFTRILYELGCNLEDASMTIHYGQYSMILVLSAPEDIDLVELEYSLYKKGEHLGISLIINKLPEGYRVLDYKPYTLLFTGSDKRGIAFKVTELLAKFKINVSDFNSKLIKKAAKTVYVIMIEAQVPKNTDFDELKIALDAISSELELDYSLEESVL